MKNKIVKKKKWYQNGFTLLFATLTASLLLSLSISILDITLQNFILSSTGRESQFAFYAADSGLDCGEYWDSQYIDSNNVKGSAFAVPSNEQNSTIIPATNIQCDGITASSTVISTVGPYGSNNTTDATTTSEFQVNMSQPNVTNECYIVDVLKSAHVTMTTDGSGNPIVDSSNSYYHTSIQSRGYNTCDPTNLRRLERGIQVDY